jgi:putative ABC transport system substrate-binding protein
VGKVYRVGLILTAIPASELAGPEPASRVVRAFVQELRSLGYVEGQNLILERRSAEGRFDRFDDIVAEVVRFKPDVIVTGGGDPLARTAKAAAGTIPIVLATTRDPVGAGLVQSLARPGGNVTGFTIEVGPETDAKRLELLKEMLPRLSRVAYLSHKENKDWERAYGRSVRTAAKSLGVTLVMSEYTSHQYTDAFAGISRARFDALFVGSSPTAYADRALIVDFATRARLPSTFLWGEAVERGGLMSYGVNVDDNLRRAASYVDKILKGARPADLPVEQPRRFELVINLKTAKALGITIPGSVLLRADRVIE